MIKKYLSVKDYSVRFLIGPNGAGKTYSIKNSLKDHEKNSLFISEDGNLEIKMNQHCMCQPFHKANISHCFRHLPVLKNGCPSFLSLFFLFY